MPSVATDSSFIYALFDSSDRAHEQSRRLLSNPPGAFIANLPVVTEVVYLLAYSRAAQLAVLRFVQDAVLLDQGTFEDLPRISAIMAKYADLPADFADASLVAMCERMGIDRIATLDPDFEVYRKVDGEVLEYLLAMP